MKIMTMAVAATMCVSSLMAADVNHLKGLPRGVQNIKYENGVISTFVVVGKADVPDALRTSPGKAADHCGKKARGEALFEFTRFLSTKCTWGETSDGETVVKEEAASATDEQGNRTSAKSSSFTETEMTKEQKEQSAQACVSGVQALWEGLNDSGEYVWVGAWNAKAAASIKNMAKTMNEAHAEVDDMGSAAKAKKAAEDKKELDAINETAAEGGEAAQTQNQKKNGDPDILKGMKKPAGTVSKDADEFL